jgi:hypothetical protein
MTSNNTNASITSFGSFLPNFSIHPGHGLFVTSLPFCIMAYRGYHHTRSLETIVDTVLKKQQQQQHHQRSSPTVPIQNTMEKITDEGIRRAVGSAIAGRALKIATMGSIGVFGMAGALLFYACGWQSMAQAIDATQTVAHRYRRKLDHALGVTDRIDKDHPEYILIKDLKEEDQLQYISNVYLPNEDWGHTDTTDEKASLDESNGGVDENSKPER